MSLSLPSFSGTTRKLILINVAVFFALALLDWAAPLAGSRLTSVLLLEPAALFHGFVWQPLTFSFLPLGILGTLFAMLSLWFTGVFLEEHFGSRWLMEFYLLTAVGAGVLASVLSYTHLFGLHPRLVTMGAWAPVMAMLVAFSVLAGDQVIRFNFILNMKAKYLAVLYVVIFLALLVKGDDRFGALAVLCGALCGWMYLKLAPRRGLLFGVTERAFGARNDYYRWKRRRAARKFEVYMRKQNREVHFDSDGRYVDPDTGRKLTERERNGKNNDKRWMN